MFQQVSRENKMLKDKFTKQTNTCIELENKCKLLESRIRIWQEKARIPRVRKKKSWSNIKSQRTKRQRVSNLQNTIFRTIQDNMSTCKRANFSLAIENQNFNFAWKPKDFKINDKVKELRVPALNDHNYVKHKSFLNESDKQDKELCDVDYTSIFDEDGHWQTKHKKGIIHVMDTYRISHEAYHELRHAGKGHFPALGEIIKEKKKCLNKFPTSNIPL